MDFDRIEREIFIAAPVERVWSLVSQAAWWVGDPSDDNHVEVDGTRAVADTRYGVFPVLIERTEAPNYLACRWASSFPGEEPSEGKSTLVEFTLTAESCGTRLRIVESGFAKLTGPDDARRKAFDDNTYGWGQQLSILQQRVEQLQG